MTTEELNLLQEYMNLSTNYLEFGMGNSTIMAARTMHIKQITIVESDTTVWHEKISSNIFVHEAVVSDRLAPLLINIGPVSQWGYPVDSSCKENWPLYHSTAFENNADYDLILVDGRFRVACILQTCLHCSSETKLLIHDFFNRPQYFVVLPFLLMEKQVDTMGVFTINKNKVEELTDLITEYISIYEDLPEM